MDAPSHGRTWTVTFQSATAAHAHTGAFAYNLSDHCLKNDDHSELQAEVDDFRAVLDAKVGPLKLFVLQERKGAYMMQTSVAKVFKKMAAFAKAPSTVMPFDGATYEWVYPTT